MKITKTLLAGLLVLLAGAGASDGLADEEKAAGPEIWQATRFFGPEIKGTIRVWIDEGEARAEIRGLTATASVTENRATLDFGSENGRLQLLLDGDSPVSFWIQPRLQVRSFTEYSSPVRLKDMGSYFEGEVLPLSDQMTFYMLLGEEAADGRSLVLINPDANRGRAITDGRLVTAEGKAEIWGKVFGEGEPRMLAAGRFDESGEMLSMDMPFWGGTYDFRVAGADSNYYSRPLNSHYSYSPPPRLNDGWETGTLDEANIDQELIEKFISRLIKTTIKQPSDGSVHALLIARHGKLVVEEYFHGYYRDQRHDTRSASKSLTGSLVGLAQYGGVEIDLDSRLYDLMGEGGGLNPDPRKADITLRHVLSMSTGLACDDGDGDSPGQEDTMQNQTDQPDWHRYMLDLEMVAEPGTVAAYCSGGISLAGGMLSRAAGQSITELIDLYFARPLGVEQYHVNLSPSGAAYMGGGLRISARDFLKLGLLMLDGGLWQGQRLMSGDYAAEAVSPLTGMWGMKYGLGWWQLTYQVAGQPVDAFFAGGNGGQQIIAVPALDLLILTYGGAYSTGGTFRARDHYVPEDILPAIDP